LRLWPAPPMLPKNLTLPFVEGVNQCHAAQSVCVKRCQCQLVPKPNCFAWDRRRTAGATNIQKPNQKTS
jgi:hypothetical protein